jgi:hypothetical protein
VRQVKSEEMDLALDATDDADGFTKVCLSMPRRMHQRHEHLLSPLTPAGHIVPADRHHGCHLEETETSVRRRFLGSSSDKSVLS